MGEPTTTHPVAGQGITAPRVYCVPDPAVRLAVVIERRPRKWWRLGLWDLTDGGYDGACWFRGTLYPQRCDLSPGGRWFCYFAFKNDSDWPAGPTYNAISRPPWLKALAAWRESGTWNRGFHFVMESSAWEVGGPAVGNPPAGVVGGLRPTAPAQFATERRRGWRESAETPPRDPADVWDERREVVMEKPSPVGIRPAVLTVTGRFEAFREAPDRWPPSASPYRLRRGKSERAVEDVQWADWTPDGCLAVVTRGGALQIRDGGCQRVVRESHLGKEGAAAPTRAGLGR